MATVVWVNQSLSSIDPFGIFALFAADGTGANSPTAFTASNPASNSQWSFAGSGFGTYVDGIPQVGTVSSVVFTVGGAQVCTITGLSMTMATFFSFAATSNRDGLLAAMFAGDDSITGAAGGEDLFGYAGADTVRAGLGNDFVYGGAGNDDLGGEDGLDRLFGEDGADTLAGGAGDDQLDGGAGDDQLDGGADNDSLVGGFGADILNGGAGNDTLVGGLGANTLLGGDGNDAITSTDAGDTIDGGAGNDSLIYDRSTSSVNFTLSLAAGTLTSGGVAVATGVESYSVRTGGGADALTLSAGVGGNFDAGGGADRVNGDFSAETNAVTLRFIEQNQTGQLTYGSGFGFLFGFSGVEAFTFIGGSAGDTLEGGTGGDDFTGNGGNDNLSGYSGNDQIMFDNFDTLVDGGAGTDYANAYLSTQAVSVVLAAQNLEGVWGTQWGDNLDARAINEGVILNGFGGNDILYGGNSYDTLNGGDGDDILVFDNFDTTVNGGAGTDYANAYLSNAGVFVVLQSQALEGVWGSSFADSLDARGMTGGTILKGFDGADTFYSGLLSYDSIDGGAGTDVVNYAGAQSLYAIVQTSPGVWTVTRDGVTDTITGVERLHFDSGDFLLG